MWKFLVVLTLAILCVHAEEEQLKKDEPQPSSVMEMALCYATPKPLNCLKEQTGRMLDYWGAKLDERKQRLLAEADEAMKASEATKEKKDDEKIEKPSEIMADIEKDIGALAAAVTGETETVVERTGRVYLLDDVENGINDDSSPAEEGRFKRKKKLKLLKLLHLGTFLKTKIIALFAMLSFHLLFKLFVITLINMAVNVAKFAMGLKSHFHGGHDGILGGIFKRNAATQDYNGDYAQQLAYGNAYQGHAGQR